MPKMIDLTGQKFGRLIVIEKVGTDKWRLSIWLCKCECDRKIIVDYSNLKRGITKSCGCLNNEIRSKRAQSLSRKRRLAYGITSMRSIFTTYKRIAKNRGLEFKLTQEQFAKLTKQDCYYCGAKPNNIAKRKGSNGNYVYNGLDRIDNTKGYTENNVVPCCKRCNIAKNNSTLHEYKNWIRRSYQKIFG